MKADRFIPIAILSALAVSCLPAEEEIEDSGASAFVATFETVTGAEATWASSDRLMVVDSENTLHRFGLDMGAATAEGEFSGDISPKSSVKYVVYAPDVNTIEYNGEDGFTMDVPTTYSAKAAGALLTANNAAVGILQGSQVELRSICGFIKFTLEGNGATVQKGGQTFHLTDICKVSLTDKDGKAFAGKLSAQWKDGDQFPTFVGVDGASTINFNTRTISTADGIYYEAGDYYIPVAPQNYETVSVTIEDTEGNRTTLADRALDVKRAAGSNMGTVAWPTVIVSANFLCSSKDESATHEVYSFASENLMCDRVSLTTGDTVAGKSKKCTVVDFSHQGVNYQLWASNGYGRATNTSTGLLSLMFNGYTASWTYVGDKWTVGSANGYAWVKVPAQPGKLSKVEITACSGNAGPINISSEVDAETGKGLADLGAPTVTRKASSTYELVTIPVFGAKANQACYICCGNGCSYRLQTWKLYYKVFE